MDVGQALGSALISLITPATIASPWLVRYWRRQLAAKARLDEASADEVDVKAEVALSGEALGLFREARADAAAAREEAREARAEAAACRRTSVELWAALDVYDLHTRRLEAAMRASGLEVPQRPPGLAPKLT